MIEPRIVSHEEWLEARKVHLAKEKEFTRLREELARERRELPWERVEKSYVFDAPEGRVTPGRPVRRARPAHRLAFHVRPRLERGLPELLVLGRQLQRRRRPPRASRHRLGGGLAGTARQARGLPQAHGLDVPLGVVGAATISTSTTASRSSRTRRASNTISAPSSRSARKRPASAPSAGATTARSITPIRPTRAASTC